MVIRFILVAPRSHHVHWGFSGRAYMSLGSFRLTRWAPRRSWLIRGRSVHSGEPNWRRVARFI